MIVAVIAAFSLAAIGTWLMIRLAPALGLVDKPNARSSHSQPTPRGGGLAIVVALTASGLMTAQADAALCLPLLAALPIAAIGLLDDRFGLSALLRLAVQLLVAFGCVTAMGGTMIGLPEILVAAVAIAWASNLFNFMDGIDGIAGMEAMFISVVAGWFIWPHDPRFATALWVVAASSAGFVLWNWSPARIFMGDVGSAYLGFVLAAIAYLAILNGLIALPVWIMLWALFIADTAVTLIRRLLRGERWWSAHRSHAYQHLSARVGSHARVTLIYAAMNVAIILPGARYALVHPEMEWRLCAVLMAIVLALVYFLGAGKPASGSHSNP